MMPTTTAMPPATMSFRDNSEFMFGYSVSLASGRLLSGLTGRSMRLTVAPESRCYASNSWLVGCLARLLQFFHRLGCAASQIRDSGFDGGTPTTHQRAWWQHSVRNHRATGRTSEKVPCYNAVLRSEAYKVPTGILRLYLELSSFTGVSCEDPSDTPLETQFKTVFLAE